MKISILTKSITQRS